MAPEHCRAKTGSKRQPAEGEQGWVMGRVGGDWAVGKAGQHVTGVLGRANEYQNVCTIPCMGTGCLGSVHGFAVVQHAWTLHWTSWLADSIRGLGW